MSRCESPAPLASTKAMTSAASDAPVATKPAMMESASQRSRGAPRAGACSVLMSDHPHRTPVGRLLAAGPDEEYDRGRKQEVDAAADPHQQPAKLLVLVRRQTDDARRGHIGRI